ncbi:MAG: FecR domain-containing protein [Spirochaetaceae bacterium]
MKICKTDDDVRTVSLRFLTAASLFLLVAAFASAQPVVVVEEVEGRVEVQRPGQSGWQSIGVGDEIPQEARISTGFRSTARLAVGRDATVTVRALTRLTINEVIEQEGAERSDMTLEIGRVRGEVRSASDRQTQFELRSPTATASVRGTTFDFDGEQLIVEEGVVSFKAEDGREHQVAGGEEIETDGVTPPDPPSQSRAERSAVSHVTPSGSGPQAPTPRREPAGVSGTATVILVWEF